MKLNSFGKGFYYDPIIFDRVITVGTPADTDQFTTPPLAQ